MDGLRTPVDDASSSSGGESTASSGTASPRAEADLRRLIIEIQNNQLLSPAEKARKIQELMGTNWNSKHRTVQRETTGDEVVSVGLHLEGAEGLPITPEDLRPAIHPKKSATDEDYYGCIHYRRNCKKWAECCQRWIRCRFCHDEEAGDHTLDRFQTRFMLCLFCGAAQIAAQSCANPDCGKEMARYYCNVCKFWDNTPGKDIFHCDGCRLCRVGKREDYHHCNRCNACLTREFVNDHRCMERSLECDCPICGEFMFSSTAPVMAMRCGHYIHTRCHMQHLATSYTCPVCLKSLGDMQAYFERIDSLMESQPMPPEYADYRAQILCNDCEVKSQAKFHFVYHKCNSCGSYNTKVLRTFRLEENTMEEQDLSASQDHLPTPTEEPDTNSRG